MYKIFIYKTNLIQYYQQKKKNNLQNIKIPKLTKIKKKKTQDKIKNYHD